MNKTWDEDDSFKHKTQSGWDLQSIQDGRFVSKIL